MQQQHLSGRTAWVTGGARGLGAAIVTALESAGACVYVGDVDPPPDAGPNVLRCNVADRSSVGEALATIAGTGRTVDILVCNAGIYPAAPFEQVTAETWRQVFAVNVDGTFHCCQAVLPGMRERGWGRIVALGSNTFQLGWPRLAAYVASKGAVTGLMRSLASEYGAHGITANTVAPTLTPTDGTRALFEHAPDMVRDVVSRQAIPRPGRPADVAATVAWLCSDAAGFITGQTVAVDGGLARL